MSERKSYSPGTFSWVDLATADPVAAKSFYSEIFGWSYEDMPTGDGGSYAVASLRDKSVAGIYEIGAEQQGTPPHWNSYVSVESADDAAARTNSLGGTVVAAPFDVMDAGRMAVLQDPTGAIVNVWEPRQHPGAGLVNEHGALCWNELCTRETARAAEFYTSLFGWTAAEEEMPTGPYTMFMNGDRPGAGMLAIRAEWGDVPPHWTVYFAVDDRDGVVSAAPRLGAKVTMEPMDIPDVGRFAAMGDPQGANFSVIEMANPPD